MELATGFVALLILGIAYCLPWIVAASRVHHNSGAIGVLNLLAGWSGIGWILAMVWSCTEVHPAAKA
jgi:hypothetical protein